MPHSSLRSAFSLLLWCNDFSSTRFITQQKGHTSPQGQCLLLKPRSPCIRAVGEQAGKFKSWVWKRQLLEALSLWHCESAFCFLTGKGSWTWKSLDVLKSSGCLQTCAGFVLTFICLSVWAEQWYHQKLLSLNTRWGNLQTLLTHDTDLLCVCISLCGWRWESFLSDAEPHFSHLWNGCYENSVSSDLIGQLCKDQMR